MALEAGVTKVSLDGIDYGTKQASFRPGGFRKTSQYASNKRTGSSKEPMGSHIEVTYSHLSTTDFNALKKWEGTAHVEYDTGDVWVVANAEVIETIELAGQGGGVRLIIEGDPGEPS